MDISARNMMSSVVSDSNLLVEIAGERRIKLKQVLLDMMQDIHNACVKNHITYALSGGSALGAVRHKGFIPWDDDLDISMLRDDFERFKQIFESELGDRYIFNAPNYGEEESKCNFGKVYKKGTELWEVQDAADNFPFPRGIYIDIFIYENIADNKFIRYFDSLVSDFMKGVGTSMIYWKYNNKKLTQYYGTSTKAKIYFKIRKSLGIIQYLIPHKQWVNLFDKFVSRHKKQSEQVTAPTGRKYYLGEIIDRTCWSSTDISQFESFNFYIPHEAEKYLLNLYGADYMQLPPENKRERHFCVKLDLGEK